MASLNRKVRTCPGDPTIAPGTTNYLFVRFNPKIPNVTTWKISAIRDPANKSIMLDGYANSGAAFASLHCTSTGTQDGLVNLMAPKPYNVQDDLMTRHQGPGQVLFLNMHAETKKWQDFVDNIPDASWTTTPSAADAPKKWTQMD